MSPNLLRRRGARLFLSLLLPWLAAAPSVAQDSHLDRMDEQHAGDHPVANPASEAPPIRPVVAEEVVYARLGDGTEVRGLAVHPEGEGPWPGVVVIHEWWGLNDNVRAMARRFAGEGYLALAVDLYEGEVADDRDGASKLARAARDRPARIEENLGQAIDWLEGRGAGKIGAVGWCFGGGWSLATALAYPEAIDATVIYYGRLVTDPETLAAISAPVLGIFGELDDGIPVETVREFEAVLAGLGKEASIHVYPGADHAFANPSGSRYQPEAAADAWNRTTEFLGRHLR